MARMVPMNAALVEHLSLYAGGNQAAADLLTGYVKSALAVTAGDDLADTVTYPVLGFFIVTSEELFTAHFVTPGRFIRMEFVSGRSLIVTMTLDRISRVVEEWVDGSLIVTVELDAQGLSGTAETSSRSSADEQARVSEGRGVLRLARPTYTLTAGPDDMGGAAIPQLTSFSIALRSAIGL